MPTVLFRPIPIYFPQSHRTTPSLPESTYSGVFKIKTPIKEGSGFLIEFEGDNGIRNGLLTCYHVMFHAEGNREIQADLSHVSITFEIVPRHPFLLEEIRDSDPVFDERLDFYYLDVSRDFIRKIKRKINFLKIVNGHRLFNEFILVHYPAGQGRTVSIGKYWTNNPEIDVNPGDNPTHLATTAGGSSGAPLIESDGEHGYVVAMHRATNLAMTYDFATFIDQIISVIIGKSETIIMLPNRAAQMVENGTIK